MEPTPPPAFPPATGTGAPPVSDLLEGLDAIVWEAEAPGGRITYVSRGAESLLGYPAEAWTADPGFWAERVVHPDDRERAAGARAAALRDPDLHEMEYRAVAADGRVLWLREVARADRTGKDGTRLRGVTLDVTRQKEAEAGLRLREAQLAEAQRRAQQGSWEWDAATGRVRWSEEMYSLFGAEPGRPDVTPESYLERVFPPDRERVRRILERIAAEGGEHTFEHRVVRDDGDVRWLAVTGAVAARDPLRLAGTALDVTERKEAGERERELLRAWAARAEAEEAEHRSAFIAEAAALLASSLDYEATLHTLAHLAVPRLADWCAVDVREEDGCIRRLAVAHPDPEKERLARELEERYPTDPDAPVGLPRVLRTGEAELMTEIPESLLEESTRDEEHLRIVRELQLRSYMVVPLVSRGRTLGAISFVSAESGRRYEEGDLAFARQLADRAAQAVDNARLFRDAERAREQTQRILESITDAFFALDHEWRFTYLNDEGERLLHRSREELLGRNVWDEFPAAVRTSFWEQYHRAVREQRTARFQEYFAPLKTWFEVRAYPSADGLSVYFRNVTEEKRAEEALRESEERYRFLAETIPAQVWTALPDGRLDYVSQRTADYFGATPEAVIGEGWLNVVHPDDRPVVLERWSRSLRTGEPYEVEFRLRRHDGVYGWHLARAQGMRDADGRIAQWFGVNTDIDDHKKAEAERDRLIAALDTERDRLREVFRQAPAFIATLRGPDHVFESANPPYLQLVGRDDILGKPVRDALPEVVEQGFTGLLDNVYLTGDPFVGDEARVLLERVPGEPLEEVFLNFVYAPLREADGSISGIFVHAVEITDQVRARQEVERKAEELARLARALEISNRELDQFAYVASHDLKAPLRGIANLSQWIEEDLGDVPAETREHMELLRGRVRRMEGLIDGILQYSRAGRVREAPTRVDVGQLLAEVVDLLAPPEEVAVTVGPMPTLETERLPLQQVFLNLVSNAVKYSNRPGARVEVTAGYRDLFWEFRVRDDGPGIAPEYHDRIFGIFQTLEARDKVEGTGIGLSLVKKLVESRGGRVWLDSAEGEGATFRFLWPVDADAGV